MSQAKRKCAFGHALTTKDQIRLYIQSDQGLHCPLIESLDITECMIFLNDTWRMHMVIWICIFCACLKAPFPLKRPFVFLVYKKKKWSIRHVDVPARVSKSYFFFESSFVLFCSVLFSTYFYKCVNVRNIICSLDVRISQWNVRQAYWYLSYNMQLIIGRLSITLIKRNDN